MARYKQIKVPELAYGPVSVRYDTEWQEYQVRVQGFPAATYHTDDRADALSTAQVMRNNLARCGIPGEGWLKALAAQEAPKCPRCGDSCTVAHGVAGCDTCGNTVEVAA